MLISRNTVAEQLTAYLEGKMFFGFLKTPNPMAAFRTEDVLKNSERKSPPGRSRSGVMVGLQ